MMRSLIHGIAVSALAVLIVGSSTGAERKFEKKFQVSPGGTLTLTTDAGDVEFTGTSSGEVSVVADIRGKERDVDGFDISAWQKDDGVEIRGRSKRSSWFSWFDDGVDVRYTIQLPREYNIQVNTSGGDITVAGMKGKVRGETSGGELKLRDIEGPIGLETSGGNVHAERLAGDVRVETSGGDIQLATVTGAVDVSTSGGNIRLTDIDGKIKGETSGGDVVVRVKGENKGISVETSGGDIEIHVPGNISANIDASTTGGDVRCDLPVTMSGRFDESRVRGTINGGGNLIHAHTSGGDVRIKTAE